MTTLSIPNSLANGQAGDASKVKANFDAVASHVNTEMINRDGSVAMAQPLSLVAPVSASHAARLTDVQASTPIGAITMYAGAAAPTNYLLCQGQAVSRTGFAALFAVISTSYGPGDGSSTFNVPDFRGKYGAGYNSGGAYAASVGSTFGVADAIVPSHFHGVNIQTTFEDNGHTHSGTTNGENVTHTHPASDQGGGSVGVIAGGTQLDAFDGGTAFGGGALYGTVGNTGAASVPHTHTFGTGTVSNFHHHTTVGNSDPAGVSATNGNLPPSVAVNFIIKAL